MDSGPIELLKAPNRRVRQKALKAVEQMGGAAHEAVPILREILKDPSLSWHWSDAFEALRQISPEGLEPVPRLIEHLQNPDGEVCSGAAFILGRLGPDAKAAVPSLKQLLKDANARVRLRAAKALAQITQDVAFLAEMFDDPEPELRQAALNSLGRFGPAGRQLFATIMQHRLEELLDPSGPRLPEAVRMLNRHLTQSRSWIRRLTKDIVQAARQSQRVTTVSLVQVLRAVVHEGTPSASAFAAQMLKKTLGQLDWASKEMVPELCALLKEPDLGWPIKRAAAEALGRLGPDAADAAPILVALLGTDAGSPNRKEALLRILARISPAALVKHYLVFSKARANEIRKLLLRYMTPSKEAVPALLWLLNCPEGENYRTCAVEILGHIGPEAAEAVPELLRVASAPNNSWLFHYLLPALRKIGTGVPEALRILTQTLHDTRQPMRQISTALLLARNELTLDNAVSVLIGLLKNHANVTWPEVAGWLVGSYCSDDPAPSVRQCAALALQRLGPSAATAVPALCELLQDPNPSMQQCVIEALEHIGPAARTAVPTLIGLLRASEPRVSMAAALALVEIGCAADIVEPILIGLLKNEDGQIRQWRSRVAEALGKIGARPQKAAPPLLEFLKDARDFAELRYAAATLIKITDNDEPVISALLGRIKVSGHGINCEAAFQIGEMGERAYSAIPALLDLLNTGPAFDDPQFVERAVCALSKIGGVSVLISLLKAPHWRARDNAAQTLATKGPAASEAIPVLMECLRDPSVNVQISARYALDKISGDRAEQRDSSVS